MTLEEIIGESWAKVIGSEFQKEYMQKLSAGLRQTRENKLKVIYPESEDVFKALKLCPFDKVKVVIIGKEPYYQGNADGLAFSYKKGERKGQGVQSLDVILDEIENDVYAGFNVNKDYELEYLAKQGVLLLNAVLTVEKNKPDSHANVGWQQFTSAIIMHILGRIGPKVFMLWGKDAQLIYHEASKFQTIFSDVFLLKAYHPAYDLHKRDSFGRITVKYPDGFTGCRHFSKANTFLLANQIGAIDWLPDPENTWSKMPPF